MRGIICLIFSCWSSLLIGQFSFHLGTGTESLSMGRTSVVLTGPSSIFGNQAAMIQSPSLSLTANASRRYNINGLDQFSVGVIWPQKLGTFGISLLQYGYKGYKEQKLGLAYARKLASETGISIQLNVLNLTQIEFGNKAYFSVELGVYSRISEIIHLGAHIFAPAGNTIDGVNGIPTKFRIGPSIKWTEIITLMK